MTAFVVTSSLEISSCSANSSRLSTFSVLVIGFIFVFLSDIQGF